MSRATAAESENLVGIDQRVPAEGFFSCARQGQDVGVGVVADGAG